MTTSPFGTVTRIRIEAPDATSAFALERRLSHLHPSAVGRGSAWCVEVEDADDRADEIVAAVRHWLREVGAHSTLMHVDGTAHTVTAHPERGPLGAGYDDERVLEHEP